MHIYAEYAKYRRGRDYSAYWFRALHIILHILHIVLHIYAVICKIICKIIVTRLYSAYSAYSSASLSGIVTRCTRSGYLVHTRTFLVHTGTYRYIPVHDLLNGTCMYVLVCTKYVLETLHVVSLT